MVGRGLDSQHNFLAHATRALNLMYLREWSQGLTPIALNAKTNEATEQCRTTTILTRLLCTHLVLRITRRETVIFHEPYVDRLQLSSTTHCNCQ
jgi:hypothetical protein